LGAENIEGLKALIGLNTFKRHERAEGARERDSSGRAAQMRAKPEMSAALERIARREELAKQATKRLAQIRQKISFGFLCFCKESTYK
jgi:hypothetical protein